MSDRDAPSPAPIHRASNLLEFFRDELIAACRLLGIQPSPHTEAYVVGLLDGFSRVDPAHRDELGFTRPAALLYGDAAGAGGERGVESYRRLGDACLVHCGFFAPTLERRGMSERYYQQIGTSSYQRLGELFGRKQPGGALALIFRELSHHFSALSSALKRVAGVPERELELDALLARMTRDLPNESRALVATPRGLFDLD